MKIDNWRRSTLVVLTGVILGIPASSQELNIRRVTTYRVKPDRIADFQAEIKEYNNVVKKANASHAYSMWSSLSGPTEFFRVDNFAKYAELDDTQDPKLKEVSADLTRIGLRITDCTESAERAYYRVRPDLSLPPTQEIPKMMIVLKVKVQPDKIEQYISMKKEYIALVKKAGIKFESVMQGRFGTSAWEFVTLESLNSWSDLDGPNPLQTALGAEALRKFNFSLAQTERENDVVRYRPELSYIPVPSTR